MKVGVFVIVKRCDRYSSISTSTFITFSFPGLCAASSFTTGSNIRQYRHDDDVNTMRRVSGQYATARSKLSSFAHTGCRGTSRIVLQLPQVGLLQSLSCGTRFTIRQLLHRIKTGVSDMFDLNLLLFEIVPSA